MCKYICIFVHISQILLLPCAGDSLVSPHEPTPRQDLKTHLRCCCWRRGCCTNRLATNTSHPLSQASSNSGFTNRVLFCDKDPSRKSFLPAASSSYKQPH